MEEAHPSETGSWYPSVLQRAGSCMKEHLGWVERVWRSLEQLEVGDTLAHSVEDEA